MFNLTQERIDSCVRRLQGGYFRIYGSSKAEYAELIASVARVTLENIARSDAAYHDVDHTILVTLAGQEILRGKHIREGNVSCDDWFHSIISLLCHDIGYIKGICHQDRSKEKLFVTSKDGEFITLKPGATDAALTDYHVDRGQLFVEENFSGYKLIDTKLINDNIEMTRFPIPQEGKYQQTSNYAGLARAADLIGQLADPHYLQKMPALFYEFLENGTSEKLGYNHPGDLRSAYPDFFKNVVSPYIQDGLHHLEVTRQGREIIASLYENVWVVENELEDKDGNSLQEPPQALPSISPSPLPDMGSLSTKANLFSNQSGLGSWLNKSLRISHA